MEKKYLQAYASIPGGRVQIVFDDIKNYNETPTSLQFEDKDTSYKFERREGEALWKEVDSKAPDISQVRVVCRRTARSHGLVDDKRTEVTPDQWQDKTSTAAAMHDLRDEYQERREEDTYPRYLRW